MELRFKPRSQEDREMKKLILMSLLLAGCSSKSVIDMKTSENPRNLTEDSMACDYLAEQVYNTTLFITKKKAWNDCMDGRGYSLIGGSR